MAYFDFDIVVKIGSMALINEKDKDLNYNIISRLAKELKPGYILVSSGAVEIGRLDYLKRNGTELKGDIEEIKTDYSAQGQAVLMGLYRNFIDSRYSVRQILVEHSHFNDPEKADHIKKFLFRCANQNAIPIINYNDPVCNEENRRWEIATLRGNGDEVVECVDNDETAAVVAELVNAEKLILLTSEEGIYRDISDKTTLVENINASSAKEMNDKIDKLMLSCVGSSRFGAAGAAAKLQYAKKPLERGCTVIIAHARHRLSDIIAGKVKCTTLKIDKAHISQND
jgi:glutamate 5-kinase